MPIIERRARQKENLRQQILEAARDLFVEDGYENLSMRKIAERIEYSPTTIYLYFKDKAELLRAICDQTFVGLIEEFEELRARQVDPVTFFKESARIYMNFALENPNQYRVTFLMPSQGVYGDLRQHDNVAIGAFDYLRGTIEAMMNEGHIRKGDVEVAAQLVWTSLHGLCAGLIMQTDFPWLEREKLIEGMLNQIMHGLTD
jgi:AcrR family transcriptional regulator